MRYICQRLFEDVVGASTHYNILKEIEYKRLVCFSENLPTLNIKIEEGVSKIKQQWMGIASVILLEGRRDLILKTLFAAARQLMMIYIKVDVNIPILHAMWLDNVIEKIEPRDSKLFYFMLFTVFIIYISK